MYSQIAPILLTFALTRSPNSYYWLRVPSLAPAYQTCSIGMQLLI